MWPSKTMLVTFLLLMPVATLFAQDARTPSREGSTIYIISPTDGDTVTSPVNVQFGLKGMGIAPAGVDVAFTGHHHLLIDVTEALALDRPIPSDETHRHFGGGQTQIELDLEPGPHTLQLVLGDRFHVPHDPPLVSKQIKIVVK